MEWITWLTTFTLIILAELGDKTQLATLVLASNNPGRRWLIFAASALALTTCVLLEVTVGAAIARVVSQDTINRVTGVVFLLVGAVTLLRQYAKDKGRQMVWGVVPQFEKDKQTIN